MEKSEIVEGIRKVLQNRVADCTTQLKDIEIARNSDSKSTAGDKHETGRAMAQLEVDRAREQLSKSSDLLASFNQINFQIESSKVHVGSLVKTEKFLFLLSVGLGKIEVNDSTILTLSAASPVGQQLVGKQVGDQFSMGPNQLTVQELS